VTNVADFPISPPVSELLKPISTELPTGKDASSEESYFRLELEIGKVSPDYKTASDLATEILKTKSKDLRVASWLCFAWFRNDRIPGLLDGLTLLRELLQLFGPKLFPSSTAYKAKSLQFLNSNRFVKLIEAEKTAKETAPACVGLSSAYQRFQEECRKSFQDQAPAMNDLARAIESQSAAAKQILEQGTGLKKEELPPPEGKQSEDKRGRESAVRGKEAIPEKPKEKPAPEVGVNLKELVAASEKDAIVAIKKALTYFFEQEKNEAKKYPPHAFGISRALVWGRLVLPPHEDTVTSINAPDMVIQSKISEWFTGKEWDRLISACEVNFLNEDSSFKYWLTAQRYVYVALEQRGGNGNKAAEEIRFHLATLLQRFPDFFRLKFSNKTLFADEETSRWIEESAQLGTKKTEPGEMILPPILGEDYDPINREYRAICAELPANFERNLRAMQEGMAGEIRQKGRFLRALNLANYCVAAKQYDLAKAYVSRLQETIEAFRLSEWEPALCLSVWESTFLINKKLISGEKNKERLENLDQQQKDLFTRIGILDGVLALKLIHIK